MASSKVIISHAPEFNLVPDRKIGDEIGEPKPSTKTVSQLLTQSQLRLQLYTLVSKQFVDAVHQVGGRLDDDISAADADGP